MISTSLALQLRTAGVRWAPARGDWFFVAERQMDDEFFVLSDMTVELQGDSLGFNGTTEWALDSVEQKSAVWLPREHQLRDLLAGTFRGLFQVEGAWQVVVQVAGEERRFTEAVAEEAYGRALLHLATGE